MNPKPFLIAISIIIAHVSYAQDNPFYGGYFRFGINQFGKKPDNNLDMLTNLTNGNNGLKSGLALDIGRIFYFNKYSNFPVKFGLDWTMTSFTYNKIDWDAYVQSKNSPNAMIGGNGNAFTANTKMGLVFSVNPVSSLVVDLRVQGSFGAYYLDRSYHLNPDNEGEEYFEYGKEENDDEEESSPIKNRIKTAFKPNFGATIRFKAIGIAFDYSPAKLKYLYSSNMGSGTGSFKMDCMQIKLSLNY